jgi:hypothetical protein
MLESIEESRIQLDDTALDCNDNDHKRMNLGSRLNGVYPVDMASKSSNSVSSSWRSSSNF